MKAFVYILLLFVLFGCKGDAIQEEPAQKLKANFSVEEKNGLLKVINYSSNNAIRYKIAFRDGEFILGRIITDTLAIHQYQDLGEYKAVLYVYDTNGNTDSVMLQNVCCFKWHFFAKYKP